MSVRSEDRTRYVRPRWQDRRATLAERYAAVVREIEALARVMGPQHEAYIARQAQRLRVYGNCSGFMAAAGEAPKAER